MRILMLPLLVLSVVVAACGGGAPATDGPEAVAQEALAKVAAKDLDGLRGLACAGQEDMIRDQLTLAGMAPGAEMLPGVDMQAILDAVSVDVSGVKVGTATTEGDVAQVPLSGSMKVTFDAEAMRPVLEQLLGTQGASMSDDQLNALLKTLEQYGQDVPVDQTMRLVREGGAWKVCQDALSVPGSPASS